MPTMQASQYHQFGDPEVLVYEDAPRPVPAEGEVLVKVHAASVNPADWKRRRGRVPPEHAVFPMIPGWDISGTVEEINAPSSSLKIGDAVYGMIRFPKPGLTYAEYVAAPMGDLVLKPHNLNHYEAAAVPLAALTAWQALFDIAHVSAGQRVLIQAAAGGVGHLAVQMAKQQGAYVIGTASARNTDFVREMGADEVIDYTTTPLEEAVHGVDVILDSLGGEKLAKSLYLLNPGGIAVTIVDWQPPVELAQQLGVRVQSWLVTLNQSQMSEITRWIEAGYLRPHVSTILPLSEAAQAHQLIEGQRTRGKIVLDTLA